MFKILISIGVLLTGQAWVEPALFVRTVAPEIHFSTELTVTTSEPELIDFEQIEVGFSCIKSLRSFGIDLPRLTDAKDLQPNSTPFVGALALFYYPETDLFHVALITKIERDGFFVKEGNYEPGKITTRFVLWDDPTLRGFHKNK